ncbi:MAG: xanthine dehydrogenase family protein molybdopterin-binding subunit [Betaproteobacteria bacterium]|nr:MAG: xanthine dehydrogenase family protein molybdopterin-binding subunit [Betaproteobacteria bacterium]
MKVVRALSVSRRRFLAAGGSLVIGFSLSPKALFAQGSPAATKLPGSLNTTPMIDSWIRLGADGSITVLTGKAELGQGVRTALIQIAAEQLFVQPGKIQLITADTRRTPDEGYTAGSNSMKDSGTAIMNAAAQVREILIARAAVRLGLSADKLKAEDGAVIVSDGRRIAFGDLVGGELTRVRAESQIKLKDPASYTVVGHSMQRVDIPAKVTGGAAYVQDLRLPGMVHARVVRPPAYGAQLRELQSASVEKMPGVLKVVHDGSYVAVVAEREFDAIRAMRALAAAARWDERALLPEPSELFDYLTRLPYDSFIDADNHATTAGVTKTVEANYRRPYQMHGAIGPSCAVGLYKDDSLTVWTHSQGVYPLRKSIAEMLKLPEDRVQCIHPEGAGCYGHNGADDAGADAALIARAFPGRPVRVQWMREQEHLWEPYGPAMMTAAKASLDGGGNIVDWEYEVTSNTHSTRPGGAGNLMPAWHLAIPFTPPQPKPIPLPEGGGDRNAIPYYKIPSVRVVHRFVPSMPIRVSALRALGAYANVFSIESFMDELALAGRTDPVEFRLRHLEDPRAREVVTLAASRFGWSSYAPDKGRGRGFAFARYKSLGAYLAVALEVDVDRETGKVRVVRAVATVDSGQAVNPDGIRNQVEGGVLQSISWTLLEAVSFDKKSITSADWSQYPILRFPELPDTVEVHVVDRPGQPFLGTGEAAQGPTAAAIANAVAAASNVRIRELPLDRKRVKVALGV